MIKNFEKDELEDIKNRIFTLKIEDLERTDIEELKQLNKVIEEKTVSYHRKQHYIEDYLKIKEKVFALKNTYYKRYCSTCLRHISDVRARTEKSTHYIDIKVAVWEKGDNGVISYTPPRWETVAYYDYDSYLWPQDYTSGITESWQTISEEEFKKQMIAIISELYVI